MKYTKMIENEAQMFLDGPITYQLGNDFATELRFLAKSNNLILININSPGGVVLGEWAIISAILELQSKDVEINTQIDGMAASAAAVIALTGNHVSMRDFATIMIHKTHLKNDEKLSEDTQRIVDLMDQSTYKIIGNRIDENIISNWLNEGDKWFNANESLEVGLIDEIIETNISNVIKVEASLDEIYLEYSKILKQDKFSELQQKFNKLNTRFNVLTKYCEYLAKHVDNSINFYENLTNVSYEDFANMKNRTRAEIWLKNKNI